MKKLKSIYANISEELKKRKITWCDVIICLLIWVAFFMVAIKSPSIQEGLGLTLVIFLIAIMDTLLVVWIPKTGSDKNNGKDTDNNGPGAE